MGVGVTGAHLAFMARRRGAVYRSTLTIGRQKLFMYEEHRPFFRAQRPKLTDGQINFILEQEYAEELFNALGAQTVDSLDISDYEGATIIEDLSRPINNSLKLEYSVVVDFGSLEHIFNVPIALKNCIDMVDVGGWYIYSGPCNNQMGHGFYQFSPELFFNFLSHNGFEEIEVFICLYDDPIFFKVTDPRFYGGRIELVNDDGADLRVGKEGSAFRGNRISDSIRLLCVTLEKGNSRSNKKPKGRTPSRSRVICCDVKYKEDGIKSLTNAQIDRSPVT